MGRPILVTVIIVGSLVAFCGLLVGGTLMLDRWGENCEKDARSKLEPARQEFESYIQEMPIQSYEIIATCDSGDDNSFLKIRVRQGVPISSIEAQFRGRGWKQMRDVQGDLYYLTRKNNIGFQVYIFSSETKSSSRPIITVYPWVH